MTESKGPKLLFQDEEMAPHSQKQQNKPFYVGKYSIAQNADEDHLILYLINCSHSSVS